MAMGWDGIKGASGRKACRVKDVDEAKPGKVK
jgi:hypothetical protein